MVVCLQRGADLHMAQLMPLPLTVSCFSKIQIGFTCLVPAHLGSPGKRAVKRVCVCVSVCVFYYIYYVDMLLFYSFFISLGICKWTLTVVSSQHCGIHAVNNVFGVNCHWTNRLIDWLLNDRLNCPYHNCSYVQHVSSVTCIIYLEKHLFRCSGQITAKHIKLSNLP